MCAVAEPVVEEGGYSWNNPVVPPFVAFLSATYLLAVRWVREDTKLAKVKEEHKAAKAAAAPAVVEAVVETPAVEAAPEPATIVAAVAPKSAGVVADWKVSDVVAWLSEQELADHAAAFKAHSINGKMLLVLDEQDLYKVLNVTSPLHRKKIMMAIADLRASYLNP